MDPYGNTIENKQNQGSCYPPHLLDTPIQQYKQNGESHLNKEGFMDIFRKVFVCELFVILQKAGGSGNTSLVI